MVSEMPVHLLLERESGLRQRMQIRGVGKNVLTELDIYGSMLLSYKLRFKTGGESENRC